jgi:hypothetical protein
MLETIKGLGNKYFGFRFVVFMVMAIVDGFYIWACKSDSTLIQLQGIVTTWNGGGILLIGGKTATDVFGKKK